MAQVSAEQAMTNGDDYMGRAKLEYDKATTRVRLEAQAVDLARANYLQTRALAYYQYAANVSAGVIS